MRVVTANLNGIRSAARKGFFAWAAAAQADLVCAQEIRAQDGDLEDGWRAIDGCRGHFHCAERKGYSGVAIYARERPLEVIEGLGVPGIDAEGRYIELIFDGLSVISLYLPSGSSGPERQTAKFAFMKHFIGHMRALRAAGREVIVCGDWNIAHREIDLKNWKSNQKNSGFLPEERAWMSQLFDELGWVDVYRRLHPEATGESYTWWSNRGQAYAKNVGWRLDYQVATPGVAATAVSAEIYKGERFSDHAPRTVDYVFTP